MGARELDVAGVPHGSNVIEFVFQKLGSTRRLWIENPVRPGVWVECPEGMQGILTDWSVAREGLTFARMLTTRIDSDVMADLQLVGDPAPEVVAFIEANQ
jgi:hypothetical protein